MKTFALFVALFITACTTEPARSSSEENSTSAESASSEMTSDGAESNSVSDCVSIQWCNEPGGIGTVCSVTAACQSQCPLQAVQDECTRQAKIVCGTIIQPFDIVCHH